MALKVGFIGLGTMGLPFATNILNAGFEVIVHDVRPEPVDELVELGAREGKSPQEVAESADIVQIAVPHEEELDAVLWGPNGLFTGAHPGSIVVIHASVHPTYI